jgi:serine/threonine protein kinase
MEHLGSVIIGATFNIFFQWADLNLEEFFDREVRPPTIRNEMITPNNLLKESTWLASALEYLHTQLLDKDGKPVHCCHMDLKPDNILVMVRDPAFPLGKWKIADFGISNIEPRSMSVSIRDFYARTTTARPETRPAAIRSLRYPGPFQPPEAESSEQARYATQKDFNDLKGDIWSFGCILLVVLVFATGGTPYVDELANRRQVYEVDFDGQNRTGRFYRKVMGPPQIMPSIVKWITPLARTQAVWFQEAWSFISNHMLKGNPANRVGAEVVRHKLSELSDKAERRNIWDEAPDLQSFSFPSTIEWPGQPSTAPSNTNITGGQSQWQSERNLRSQKVRRVPVPPVSPIREDAEPVTPERTMMSPTRGEGPNAIVTQNLNQGYSPASETPSHRSSTSNRSGSSGSVGSLSQDLSKEKNLVMSSDGQRIAFWNHHRAKIFSKRPDDPAFFSKEIVQNIDSRHNSTWEQIRFAGPVIALRDQKTLNVSEFRRL